MEDDYRGDEAFDFVFRRHTNGRILPEENERHGIKKRFVPVVLLTLGALITIIGTAIGADIIARSEANRVKRDVFTQMAQADGKQLSNAEKIANKTSYLLKTVKEHSVELVMNRIADYLALETEKVVGILHSLLTPSGTWSLGDKQAANYSMILQQTILKNYGGLNAAQLEEVRMLTAGTTIISTLIIPRVEGNKLCSNMKILKTLTMPIIDHNSMMVHHRCEDGLWENNGHLRHFSLTGFYSGFSRLDGNKAKMVGRTCEIKNGIKMAQSKDMNFLHERFLVQWRNHKISPSDAETGPWYTVKNEF